MRNVILFIFILFSLTACGEVQPVNPPNSKFSGRELRVVLYANKFYQRPEQHGLVSIKNMMGDDYAIEKISFVSKKNILKVLGLRTADAGRYGLTIKLDEEGINNLKDMFKMNMKRKAAVIVDNVIVSTFVIDQSTDGDILTGDKLRVYAKFSGNEVEAIFKGLNKK